MISEAELQTQLEHLQAQHTALQAQYQALQVRQREQEASANQWLDQRTEELKAEAREQRKAETLQRVFYRIAERAAADLSFYDFLQAVHGLLGELLYAKNCYVCLYDAKKQIKDFPYYVDERDGDALQLSAVPLRRGLTEFVLRTAQPQIIDAERLKRLEASGDVTEGSGDMSFSSWLGVPMQIRGQIGGILAVQGYEPGIAYTPADADILSFVANHVSSAIERYQALDALRNSEARYRTVIENVGVGVVVVQDGRLVFANASVERVVDHPLDYLLSQPFTAVVHPDDLTMVVERHGMRLRGEPVDANYDFRIITQTGEVRIIELSAVRIEWAKQDAVLLFLVDTTARREAEQTKRISLQKQIELNDMKTRFISMASHEFRTPLATIHGSVELLLHYDDRMPADKKRQTLQKIDDAVERMTHMLENVLVIGRTGAGQLEFKPRPMAITPFCMGLLDELRSTMARQYERVNLVLDMPPHEQQFLLDETLIRNIAGNLLSNAIKYSPDGGKVSLRVQVQADHLVMTVRDQGIGIPEADQAHLFESFHRASNVGPIAGTGLGLSIVKDAVTCHLGNISVQSQVGQGSCFTVTLPNPAMSSAQATP
jgi:PAS domain S-box-containing protein